jgi:hypothetical protein
VDQEERIELLTRRVDALSTIVTGLYRSLVATDSAQREHAGDTIRAFLEQPDRTTSDAAIASIGRLINDE